MAAAAMMWLALPFVGMALSYVVLVVCYGILQHYKYRHIPGPKANLFFGNLLECVHKDLYLMGYEWTKKYGKMFVMWFGQRPQLWISDGSLMHEIGVKRFSSFYNRAELVAFAFPQKALKSLRVEVLLAKQPLWGSLRAALQPLFHTASLDKYAPFINEAAVRLRQYFEEHVVPEGQTGASCEVREPLAALSIDVVGYAAMGCNMGSLDELSRKKGPSIAPETTQKGPPSMGPLPQGPHTQGPNTQGSPEVSSNTYSLFSVSEDIFSNATMGSAGTLMQLLGPSRFLQRFWIWLTLSVFKDKRALLVLRGRTRLFAVARSLYRNALKRLAAEGENVPPPDDSWVWWEPKDEEGNPCKDMTPCEGSLADMLAKAKSKTGNGGLSELEIVTNIYEMLAAGGETTTNTLCYTLYLLSTHNSAEAELLAEIDKHGIDWAPTYEEVSALPYLDAVIKESMRLMPAAPMTNREAAEDYTIGNLRVPKGTSIVFDMYSLGRDPTLFPDAEEFKPERWLGEDNSLKQFSLIAFGLGPRNCIGQRLALEEMKITLLRLYQTLTFDVDMTWHANGLERKQNLTVQPVHGVHMFPRLRTRKEE